MVPSLRRVRFLAAFGLPLALCLPIGCGSGEETASTVPASGTIVYDGKPLEQGNIQFVPVEQRPNDKSFAIGGRIEGGKFSIATGQAETPGAPPGKYKVVVTSYQDVPLKGGDTATKSLLPDFYADAGKSPVTIELPSSGSTKIQLTLTKDGR